MRSRHILLAGMASTFFWGAGMLPAQVSTTTASLDPAPLVQVSADELLQRLERTIFPESFVASMRMTTERPGRRTTEMVLDNFHLEGAGTFMEVTAPSRSRGMRFLQKESELWMYNPRSGSRRAIRLSPRDSFQGSVFSNNDVSDPDYSDDYRADHAGTASIAHATFGTVECVVIEAVASHDEAPYGRIVIYLTSRDGRAVPLQFDYYSRSGLYFKRMTLDRYENLAGAFRPRVMRMESLEEEGAVTTVTIETLEARDDIPSRLFNQQELTR
jgi:hypothetical protein